MNNNNNKQFTYTYKDGSTYRIHPSALGAKELTVTTPEVVVTPANNLVLKEKEYQATPLGLMSALWDKANGTNTYYQDKNYTGEIKEDTRSAFERNLAYQLQHNNTPLGYMAQTVIPTGAVAASLVGAPAVARAMPAIARDALFNPLGTGLSIGGGAAGGWLVNKATQALTGKTYGEKLGELTNSSPVLAAMTNPGMLAGGLYGGFVGNNYANLGRYTLNYMYPASYGRRQFLTIPKIYTKPLYKAPPTFYNGRKPEWYDEYTRMRGVEEAEARFQNGAK